MTGATGEFTALASAVRVRLVSWFIIRAAFARHNTSQTRLAGHKDFYQRFLRQAGCRDEPKTLAGRYGSWSSLTLKHLF